MWSESMSLNSMTRVVMRKKVMIQIYESMHRPQAHLNSSHIIIANRAVSIKRFNHFRTFLIFFQFPSSKTSLHTKITNAGNRLCHYPWERKGQEDVTK